MLSIKEYVLIKDKIGEFYNSEDNPQKQAEITADLTTKYPEYNIGLCLKLIKLSQNDEIDEFIAVLNSLVDKKTFDLSITYPYQVLDPDQPEFNKEKVNILTVFLKKRAEYLEANYVDSHNKTLYLKELFGIYDALKDSVNLESVTKKLIVLDFNYMFIKRHYEGNVDAPHRQKMNDFYRLYQDSFNEWNNTIEEKMQVFSKVFSEIKYNSASLKIAKIQNWDEFANSYIPKLVCAKNKLDFYELLAEMVHKIGDNHNRLSFPEDIEKQFFNPGLRLNFINNKFYACTDHDHDGIKICKGDELIKINDKDIFQYIEENQSKYPLVKHFHFLPKFSTFYKMGNELLTFSQDKKLKADFIRLDNSVFSVEFSPKKESDSKKNSSETAQNKIAFEMLENSILLIEIPAFWGGNVYADFVANLKNYDIQKIRGIIFDVRRNAGGNSGIGDKIFSHFTNGEVKNYFMTYTKVHIPIHSLDGIEDIKLFDHMFIKPSQNLRINCPVAVLTSPYTGSAAEGFVFLFKYYKRGKIIGLPTSGSTGNPLFSLLKGGGFLRVNLNISMYFTCKGIEPDIYIENTITDLLKGSDSQLNKAVEYLINKKDGDLCS